MYLSERCSNGHEYLSHHSNQSNLLNGVTFSLSVSVTLYLRVSLLYQVPGTMVSGTWYVSAHACDPGDHLAVQRCWSRAD